MLGQIELTNLHKINLKRKKSYTGSQLLSQMKPDVYAKSSCSKNAGVKSLNNVSFGSGEEKQDGIRKLSNRLIMLTKQETIDDKTLEEIEKILNRPSTGYQDISYKTKQKALYNALDKGHFDAVELIFEKLEPKYSYSNNEKSRNTIETDILASRLITLTRQEIIDDKDIRKITNNYLFRNISRKNIKEAIYNMLEKGNFDTAELVFSKLAESDRKAPSRKEYKENKSELEIEDKEIKKDIITARLKWVVKNMADIEYQNPERQKEKRYANRDITKIEINHILTRLIKNKNTLLKDSNAALKECDLANIKDERTGFTLLRAAIALDNRDLVKSLLARDIIADEQDIKYAAHTNHEVIAQTISDHLEAKKQSGK